MSPQSVSAALCARAWQAAMAACQAHAAHQASHPLAVDPLAGSAQVNGHPAAAVERRLQGLLVQQLHQGQIVGWDSLGPPVDPRPAQPQHRALLGRLGPFSIIALRRGQSTDRALASKSRAPP